MLGGMFLMKIRPSINACLLSTLKRLQNNGCRLTRKHRFFSFILLQTELVLLLVIKLND